MRHEMFEDLVEPSVKVGTRRWYTVPLSIASHVALVAAFVVIPLSATYVFPSPQSMLAFAAPPPRLIPPPPPAVEPTSPPPVDAVVPNPDAAPLTAPDRISDEPPAIVAVPRVPARLPSSGGSVSLAAPQPQARLATPPPANPIPVGGAVKEPRKVHHAAPVYPAIARLSRREGLVILEATIARDGTVRDVRVLRSEVMFDQAAMDAVRQWRYTPPTLNGIPVDVTMTVTVTFRLN